MPADSTTPQSSPFEIVTPAKPKKVSPRNFAIILVILIFVGVSIFLGVYLVGQRQNLEENAAPATAMYITPGSQSKTPGSTFSFTVNIDTSTNSVTGVDARVTFNPNVMQVVSLQQGAGVTNLNQTITNTYDNSAGTINYAIFTLDGTKAVRGSGIEVLKVNAQVVSGAQAGTYNLAFDPASAASASQEGQNVLVSKSQGTLIVAAGTGGANATPTATATATATAQATGTPIATATPTATATAAGATATATATPVATQGTPLPIPVTGTDWPTYLAVAFGLIITFGAIVLAL